MLRLKTTGAVLHVWRAAFSHDAAVKKIARIELHTGLGGGNLHHSTGLRFAKPGGESESVRARAQHEVVIIAAGQLQLFVIITDARPDRRRRS
jgi:hypothetical protein